MYVDDRYESRPTLVTNPPLRLIASKLVNESNCACVGRTWKLSGSSEKTEDQDDNYVFVTPTTFEIRSVVMRRHDRAPLWVYAMLEIQLKES
jgi:hypothetical protein